MKNFIKDFFWFPSLIGLILYSQILNFAASWGDDVLMIQPRAKDFHLMLESFYNQQNNKNFDCFGVFQAFVINKLFGHNAYPFGFHLYSLILHTISGLLITLVLYKITKNKFVSVLMACLWAVHPINVETVTRLGIAPFHLAAGTFCLCSFLCFLRAIEITKLKELIIFSSVGLFFFLISITSNEQYLFFPLVILFTLFYLKGSKIFLEKKYIFSIIAPIFLIYPCYFFWRYIAFGHNLFYAGETLLTWADLGSLKDILFRAFWLSPQLIVHYFRLFLWTDYLAESKADWYMVGGSILSTYSLFCQLVVFGMVISAIALFRKNPLFSIGTFWFLLPMALVIQIIPLFSIVDEHYCYLSSM